MDVRASDSERDAMLRNELVPLTTDLPVTVARSEPADVRKVGDIKRKGAWVVPAECRFRSYFGAVIVDLREATITAQELRIDARTPFGNIVLLVPEGVDVEVRANAVIGKLKQEQSPAVPRPRRRRAASGAA